MNQTETGLENGAVRVVDLPSGSTAGQTEDLLNAPYAEGYYLAFIVGWGGFGARAFYKRRLRASGAGRNKTDRDGEDEAAKKFIRDNDALTVQALVKKLAARGIMRGKTWVSAARIEARTTGLKYTSG